MSFGPAPPFVPGDRRELLFTPGPRLGWMFRDRRELASPYPEPRPAEQLFQAQAAARLMSAEQALARAWRWVAVPSLVLALVLVLAVGCAGSWGGSSIKGAALTITVLCGPGLVWTACCRVRCDRARTRATGAEYRQALAAWSQRAARHEAAELARLAGVPEWGSVTSPASRTDIFGGTRAGWQALLTVHGASMLAERRLLAIDLTGQDATSGLVAAASATRVSVVTRCLPRDLAPRGPLAGLSPAQLASAIAAAMHAGGPPGAPARCTCVALVTAAPDGAEELLQSLIADWLTRHVSTSAGNAPAVIIAGADAIARSRQERLADACERRGVPLTLMFRHLPDDDTASVGRGTAAFMRLANQAEAERAATSIGRGHTFVLSSYTARTTGTGTSRGRPSSSSPAERSSRGTARPRQRSHSFDVEPVVLRNLPEHALLLADRSGTDLRLRAIECDPSIITLPGASTEPLPPPDSPDSPRVSPPAP